jgi:hypothetical protein
VVLETALAATNSVRRVKQRGSCRDIAPRPARKSPAAP